jgi:hypothetical protein
MLHPNQFFTKNHPKRFLEKDSEIMNSVCICPDLLFLSSEPKEFGRVAAGVPEKNNKRRVASTARRSKLIKAPGFIRNIFSLLDGNFGILLQAALNF